MNKQSITYAIIPAGGIGSRTGYNIPKQFIEINKKPLIAWTLEKFQNNDQIDKIIITSPTNYIETINKITSKFNISKTFQIIPGGKTRQESVYNAISCHNFNDNDIIIIHDAARPFVKNEIIKECLSSANEIGASGTYINAVDTITVGKNNFVESIPNRNQLFYTQTPQCFRYGIIKEAHDNAKKNRIKATDDISLVINTGTKVKIVKGTPENIKITSKVDIELAKILLNN